MFFHRSALPDGEQVVWEGRANHLQGRRAVGGWLTVTTRTVLFEPNAVDRLVGGRRLRLGRADIASVTLVDGIVVNLEISLAHSSERFKVSDPFVVSQAMAAQGPGPARAGT